MIRSAPNSSAPATKKSARFQTTSSVNCIATNGNNNTDVLANAMFNELRNANFSLSSAFAVLILLLAASGAWLHRLKGKTNGF